MVWMLLEFIPTMYIIFLWQSMNRSGSVSDKQYIFMLVYQIVTLIIARLAASHFESWVVDDIKNGKMSRPLLQPVPYPVFLFVLEAVWRVFGFVYLIPVLLVVAFVWGNIFVSAIIWQNIGWFAVFIILSYIQRFCISLLIASVGFWVEQAQALSHFKWMLEGVLAGSWLPLVLYPAWIQKISSFTPLYYWYHVPSQIIMNPDFTNLPLLLGGSVFWAVILLAISSFVWKKSIRHYSAVGA